MRSRSCRSGFRVLHRRLESLLSSGFGLTLSRPRVRRSFARLAPVLGVLSLAFGVWYALGAQSLVPYVF